MHSLPDLKKSSLETLSNFQTMIDWRNIILRRLQMLASEERQLEYEKNVPHVDITGELVEGWFSDAYHPSDELFRNCFSKEELHEFALFSELFEDIYKKLPSSGGTVRTWLECPVWTDLRKAASNLCVMITPTHQRELIKPS